MYNLSKNVKATLVLPYAAAGQTTLTSTILDMAGFDGVLFVLIDGNNSVVGAVITLNALTNNLNQQGGMAAVAGGTVTFTEAGTPGGKALLLEVFRPQQEFIEVQVVRTTQNSEIYSVLAIQYRGYKLPTIHDVNTIVAQALAAF